MPQPAERADAANRRTSGPRSPRARPTRRALLLTALGGLLVAGAVTAVPAGGVGGGLSNLLGQLGSGSASNPVVNTKRNHAVVRALGGDCLMWPENTLDAATAVSCADEHKFEVAEAVDMRTFPGAEYGPDAPPPSAARIEQITQEQCESAVRRYLGPKYDPHSKFVASMLWSGDRAWSQYGERQMLCGLQLPGPNGHQLAFSGRVAEIDQSKVWPAGTCLGIDPTTNQPTDIPVDCAAPHTKEVTGTVNLGERFPDGLPPEAEQDAFIKDECTRLTDTYLAPVQLRDTTLTLTYATLALPSWAAGSREVACSIGATLGNGGWAALLNNAGGPLLINGQPPVPPPEIPAERLNPLPIPMPVPQAPPAVSAPPARAPEPTGSRQGSDHLPQRAPGAAQPAVPAAPAQPAVPAAPAPPAVPAAPAPPPASAPPAPEAPPAFPPYAQPAAPEVPPPPPFGLPPQFGPPPPLPPPLPAPGG